VIDSSLNGVGVVEGVVDTYGWIHESG